MLALMPVPERAQAAAWSTGDALRQLSPSHRDVLLCLHYHRWSLAQTAEHLGVEADVVKLRLTFALRALKLLLEETDSGD